MYGFALPRDLLRQTSAGQKVRGSPEQPLTATVVDNSLTIVVLVDSCVKDSSYCSMETMLSLYEAKSFEAGAIVPLRAALSLIYHVKQSLYFITDDFWSHLDHSDIYCMQVYIYILYIACYCMQVCFCACQHMVLAEDSLQRVTGVVLQQPIRTQFTSKTRVMSLNLRISRFVSPDENTA